MMNGHGPSVAKAPCASCPYRQDVPSGVWSAEDYAKLPLYDAETWEQPTGLFMCHKRTGGLCAGWLGCHGRQTGAHDLLALRLHPISFRAQGYASPVPVFASGAAAAAHGVRDIDRPGAAARLFIARLGRTGRLAKIGRLGQSHQQQDPP